MRSSFTLGQVAGIKIGIHYTWLLAFVLIAWSLAQGYFPDLLPRSSQATYWLMGIAGALLLFASVLVHELSHSLVARRRGLQVDSITLFIFGGVSNLTSEATKPGDEFLVAVVGPATSLILAAVFWAIGQVLPTNASVAGVLVGYIAFANAILGAFNLVPGFPLDGGRVLRGIVWGATGSLRQATRVASYVGQAVGFLLIFWGLATLLGGDFLSGLWIAFIGWFLSGAAESARQEQAVRQVLSGVAVRTVMDPAPPRTTPETTVESFVFEYVLLHGQRAVLVVDGNHLLGIVTVADAKRVERTTWSTTPVSTIMTPVPLFTVGPDNDLSTALQLMVTHSVHQLPVVTDGDVLGVVSRSEILEMLHLRDELRVSTAALP